MNREPDRAFWVPVEIYIWNAQHKRFSNHMSINSFDVLIQWREKTGHTYHKVKYYTNRMSKVLSFKECIEINKE
jgi:hypothetical protein